MIKSIKIEKLFDLFDYDISFQNEENIVIITGPNGFGKTKILNIIYSLFNREFSFFDTLVFEKITLFLDNELYIIISKNLENRDDKPKFQIFENNEIVGIFNFSSFYKITTTYSLSGNSETNDVALQRLERAKVILDSTRVHMIKEQRLLKIKSNIHRYKELVIDPDMQQNIISETIESFAQDLKQIIAESIQSRDKVAQELDSSYPKRLLNETDDIEIEEFKSRFNVLKEKQHKLKVFGISENEQEVPGYSKKNSTALFVYLKDSEKKISVFDELVGKLELFANILNERRLTFKSIKILKDKGFIFITDKGNDLKLTDLSSGEQHEVVLLYELIFNVKQNTVLLIDEPEISLHITWQKEFIKDLIKIIKLQKIQVIIATHAPSIINDRWDLVYSLDKAGV